MKVITVGIEKGGVGKTTTSLSLAEILRKEHKKRVLLIDSDPQMSATKNNRALVEDTATLYDVILDDEPIPFSEAVQHTEYGDMIASDPKLRQADAILNGTPDGDGRYRFADAIEVLKKEDLYDYVIIDTAPRNDTLFQSALIASDELIIPVTANAFDEQNLAQLYRTAMKTKMRVNPRLNITGFLMIKYGDRMKLELAAKKAIEKDAEQMGTRVFKSYIRETVRVREAQSMHEGILDYAPYCNAAIDYKKFVVELLGIMEEREND